MASNPARNQCREARWVAHREFAGKQCVGARYTLSGAPANDCASLAQAGSETETIQLCAVDVCGVAACQLALKPFQVHSLTRQLFLRYATFLGLGEENVTFASIFRPQHRPHPQLETQPPARCPVGREAASSKALKAQNGVDVGRGHLGSRVDTVGALPAVGQQAAHIAKMSEGLGREVAEAAASSVCSA